MNKKNVFSFQEDFTLEQKWIHHLMLHSRDITDIGLFSGKFGIALVLFKYAKHNKSRAIQLLAESLIEEVLHSLGEKISLDLATGLCGIGWGIEYLLQNRFMKGDSLDICEVIDKKIVMENPLFIDDVSLDTGLEGKLHYILAHIQGTRERGVPFPPEYLIMLKNKLKAILETHSSLTESMKSQISIYMDMTQSKRWYYELNLSYFVNTPIKPSRNILNLRDGLAGYIENYYLNK